MLILWYQSCLRHHITVSQVTDRDRHYKRPKLSPDYVYGQYGGFGCRRVYHYTAEPYQSQFFYSHLNGYRLQLSAEVICHCSNCRQAVDHANDATPYNPRTEMSFAVNMCIFKGDHDSQLKWPFKEEVTITMYQENDSNIHKLKSFAAGGNPNYCNKILHAVAIFEGNQNYKNNGSKLNIKSVAEREETDLIHTPQQVSQLYKKHSTKK